MPAQAKRLSFEEKKKLLDRVTKDGLAVSRACREAGVSRDTFYRIYRRWLGNGKVLEPSLSQTFSRGAKKRITHDHVSKVKKIFSKFPNASKYAIAEKLSRTYPDFKLSPSGVYCVLKGLNMNLASSRLAWATRSYPNQIYSADYTVNKFDFILFTRTFIIVSLFVGASVYSGTWWIDFISSITAAHALGIVFASIALICGTFFLLYSMKYYITLAVVLSFSQSSVNSDQSAVNGRKKGLLSWILGNLRSESKTKSFAAGLTPDLSHITLEKYPFISVHIPFYNEKKVVERSIQAAVNFDYKGDYEVILCDDSTDETTQIIANYLKSQAPNIKSQTGDDWKLTQGEVRPGVVVKHIHRSSRAGFKGGALELARKLTDPRAEFVSVFDADFVPYPDTLTLFLKYFLASSGTLDFKKVTGGNKNTNHQSLITNHNPIAAVQGYQWHVLNKSENWITRGVRSEYSGSYVIERSGTELYGGLKQISGSVYMIRKDILDSIGWGTSITEDFELTLKLYEKGYKVVYTPYIQAPSECVSTIKRLVRQRMRWAEGHSYNIRRMFPKLITNPNLTTSEKLEFLYLSPYYLQAFFFLIGTISWLISETIFPARLPFWTALWGWSLVLTNMISLPLMNAVGMFLEESEERDYLGLASFVALSYIMVPFQAYASIKGFFEKEEGPWFRTPKTGRITDIFRRGALARFISGIFPAKESVVATYNYSTYTADTGSETVSPVYLKAPRRLLRQERWGNIALSVLMSFSVLLFSLAPFIPIAENPVFAAPPRLASLTKTQPETPEKIEEITTPVQIQFETPSGEILEMIFHKEPRVRLKLGIKELELTTTEIKGIGPVKPVRSLIANEREVRYEEIVPGVDLVYQLGRRGFTEKYVIKRPLPVTGVVQRLETKEINVLSSEPATFSFFDNQNNEIFKFGNAFLEELVNRDNKNEDVALTLTKGVFGYDVEKTIDTNGLAWLNASERAYPVVLDPPVTIVGSGYANGTDDYGGIQRKVVFMETRDRYYAVANVSSSIQLWISDNNTGSAWTQLSDIDDDNDDHDPTIVMDDNTFWIAWNDQSNDNPQFRRITTDASSETYEAVCTGPDMGAVGAVDINAFGVASTYLYFYNDNDPDVYRITKSEYPGSCESTDFTSITNTTDGPTAGGEGIFEVTSGDELHAVWRTTSGVRHGIYSGSEWNTSAPFTVNSFNSDEISMVKDASNNLYVSAEGAAGELHVYRCSATCTGSWSDLGTAILDTDCAASYTNITTHSLTYDSTNNDLILFAIATDATNERACFRASSDMGSTWEGTTWDLGYVSTDLAYISSTHTVSDPSKAAVTLM